MTNESRPEADEVPTVERMGYYKDAKTGQWVENGKGVGWCKECGAKIRFCKCSENASVVCSSCENSESKWADHYHSKLVEAQEKGYLPDDFSF